MGCEVSQFSRINKDDIYTNPYMHPRDYVTTILSRSAEKQTSNTESSATKSRKAGTSSGDGSDDDWLGNEDVIGMPSQLHKAKTPMKKLSRRGGGGGGGGGGGDDGGDEKEEEKEINYEELIGQVTKKLNKLRNKSKSKKPAYEAIVGTKEELEKEIEELTAKKEEQDKKKASESPITARRRRLLSNDKAEEEEEENEERKQFNYTNFLGETELKDIPEWSDSITQTWVESKGSDPSLLPENVRQSFFNFFQIFILFD